MSLKILGLCLSTIGAAAIYYSISEHLLFFIRNRDIAGAILSLAACAAAFILVILGASLWGLL